MGRHRPFKVRYHFDGCKQFSDDELAEAYVIDTSRPIKGCSSHPDLESAEGVGRRVSRNGGTARITLRDRITGNESELRLYAPHEVAMEDLVREHR